MLLSKATYSGYNFILFHLQCFIHHYNYPGAMHFTLNSSFVNLIENVNDKLNVKCQFKFRAKLFQN